MSYANKKLKGRLPNALARAKSGIWTSTELANIRREQEPFPVSFKNIADTDNLTSLSDSDPYYSHVIAHYSDMVNTDSGMRDISGYRHDAFVVKRQADWPISCPHHNGPRHYHSTYFYDQSYTVTDTANLRLGTSAFTIEFWINLHRQDGTEHYVMGKGGNAGRTSGTGWVVYLSTTYNIGFYDAVGNASTQTGIALNRDRWYHVAIVRTSTGANDTRIYVDGVLQATGTSSGNFTDTSTMYIGRDRANTAASYFGGKLTDIRIKNTAVYSAAFAQPTAPLNMDNSVLSLSCMEPWHPNSPGWQRQGLSISVGSKDVSRTLDTPFMVKTTNPYLAKGFHSASCLEAQWFRIKDYSAGGSNYLNFGTGPFTVEAWIRLPDIRLNMGICGKGTGNIGAAGSTGWSAYIDTNGNPAWSDGATTIVGSNTARRVTYGGWYHIAFVRENTATNGFKIYINLQLAHTATLATNYTGTDSLNVFATRNAEYSSSGAAICGLRISKEAIGYSGNLNWYDYGANYTYAENHIDWVIRTNQLSNSANTTLLMFGAADLTREIADDSGFVNDGYAQHSLRWRHGHWFAGERQVSSRTSVGLEYGGHSVWVFGGYTKVLARTAAEDFNFGTGDFTIEFYAKPMHDTVDSSPVVLFDNRDYWNDSGISLSSTRTGFEVITGNQIRLTSDYGGIQSSGKWMHICIQRTSGNMALYLNGKRLAECRYTGAIAAPQRRWYIGNGSYSNLRWGSGFYGYISNFRVVKGVAVYGITTATSNNNPTFITVPTRPLTATAETVLLTCAGPTFKDYSNRNLEVAAGGFTNLNENMVSNSAWDLYISNQNPFQPDTDYNCDEVWGGGQVNVDSGFYTHYPENYYYGDRAATLGWIPRMSRAWTIECWFFGHETNPGAPGHVELLRCGETTNNNGFQLYYHINSSLAASRNDIAFRMWLGTVGNEYFGSSGSTGNLKPHGWNHAAVVYDPTKTNKLAIFCNGQRVATRAAFTPSNKIAIDGHLYSFYNTGGVRISDIARYDNDAVTVPYSAQKWAYDANTFIHAYPRAPIMDSSQRSQQYMYGIMPDRYYKKFGNASIKFPNDADNTVHVNRLVMTQNWWNTRYKDLRRQDATIECWASWQSLAAGGKAFPTATEGACLWHFGNAVWVGISPTGYWQCMIKNANSTTYDTWTSDVLVGQQTAVYPTATGTWDYVVLMRSGRNWIFYVNGVEKAIMRINNNGTFTNGPTYNHDWDIVNWSEFLIGADNSALQATKWCGHVQDFRWTGGIARYETRVIDGVATMVHRGSDIPALPTRLHPTK